MSAAPFLPPVPRPPHDPLRFRLDRRAGWRGEEHAALTHGVAPAPGSGDLEIVPLPGSGPLLNDPSGSFGGVAWPDHAASSSGGDVVLLDRARGVLRLFDRCDCRFEDWPCLGRDPADPRRPSDPGGIAVGCGQLYLADTGHRRVLVISLATGTVRAAWSTPSVPGLAPWQPEDVVVTGALEVVVSDPANGGIHVFSPYGAHRRFFGGLGAVASVTVDVCNRLYVRIDGAAEVLVVDLASGRVLERPARPEAVADRFPALPVRVLSGGALDVSALCECPPDPPLVVDTAGEPTDAAAAAPAYPLSATWVSVALDSEIARCVWDRVVLGGRLPPGTAVEVRTLTAESDEPPDLLALRPPEEWARAGTWRAPADPEAPEPETDFLLHSPPGRYLWLKLEMTGDGTATPALDALEIDFPRISLRRYLPAVFGAEPVAAELTDRFLAIFDRGFRQIEGIVDGQARYFDPLAAPAGPRGKDFLSWLAGWVGVALERSWSEARRRIYLKSASRVFPWRGTVQGLRQSLYLFLGLDRWVDHAPEKGDCVPCPVSPPSRWRPPRLILEHFRLRRWMFVDHARLSDNARLWGERIVNRSRLGTPDLPGAGSGAQLGVTQLKTAQDPCRDVFHHYAHKLSVFVPAACVRDPSLARALKRLVELERPAHVQYDVVPVEPRFRVGVQSMLGLDAVVGWQPQPVALDSGVLGRGTVLTSALDDRPRLHIGEARVGEGTALP